MFVRHPLTLLTREVPPLALSRKSLLLVQDLHAPFADPIDGFLAQRARRKILIREFDEYFQTLASAAPNLPRLVSMARDLRLPVAYSCLGYFAPGAPSPFQRATGWTWELGGLDGRFPSEWAPRAGEEVFAKPGWSALAGEPFVRFLRENSIESVILAGAIFEFGIRQTCLDLADRGIPCLVVADAVVALTESGERQARGEIAHGLSKLRSTGELLQLLERVRAQETVWV
ncbi:MAG: isochorismatase family cysteine hydrolase [Vicinamibacteria bacterium]